LIRQGPHRKHRVEQFFCCCACIHYHRSVFTKPLSNNDYFFWLHYSGFQTLGKSTEIEAASCSHSPYEYFSREQK
jgi:hypothetical protein